MKSLNYILATVVVLLSFGAYAQSNGQQAFLKKFESFKETPYAKMSWTLSPDASESAAHSIPMPNPIDVTKTHTEDPESGLWHYTNIGKVLDPETGYYIDYDAHRYYMYRVDSKAGKIYKGKPEIEVKRQKVDESKG
ncbi:hypothetical protein [Pontibacter harenae]|uniref:hypothetical protein n=1 Tax=Pontibacter harenae TaxID=2894083 RepID=UPI001E5BFBBA|nr:hypothetical protein [Pontibacter harenae]MCC9165918.1 hypothetical protein [Pontibacter harenae]